MDCDDEPLTFSEQLLLAVAPPVCAALVEFVVAPLVGHAVTKTKRTKAKTRAASRGFASYVTHERKAGLKVRA